MVKTADVVSQVSCITPAYFFLRVSIQSPITEPIPNRPRLHCHAPQKRLISTPLARTQLSILP